MMAREIKTAEQHISDIDRQRDRLAAEKREYKRKQAALEWYDDLTGEVLSVLANSGLADEDLKPEGGPTVTTVRKWRDRRTKQPKLSKLRSVLIICEHDFQIVPRKRKAAT